MLQNIDEILYDFWARHRDCKDGCQSTVDKDGEGTKQALVDLLLGLPSLQAEMDSLGKGREAMLIEAIRNGMRDTIRQEIAEALGLKEDNAKE